MRAVYTVCTYSTHLPGSLRAQAVHGSVQAGFASPAEDHAAKRIDVLEHLVKHPQATFQMKVRGESMRDAGIADGDMLIVDRAIPPRSGHVVVAVVDSEFTVKTYWKRAGRVKLKAANPTYPDIEPKDGQTVEVWGVVVATIKRMPL
ncbi:repressor [Methylibium sp. Root1272]|nr:repressor [Methylibium sp. Root1272]